MSRCKTVRPSARRRHDSSTAVQQKWRAASGVSESDGCERRSVPRFMEDSAQCTRRHLVNFLIHLDVCRCWGGYQVSRSPSTDTTRGPAVQGSGGADLSTVAVARSSCCGWGERSLPRRRSTSRRGGRVLVGPLAKLREIVTSGLFTARTSDPLWGQARRILTPPASPRPPCARITARCGPWRMIWRLGGKKTRTSTYTVT